MEESNVYTECATEQSKANCKIKYNWEGDQIFWNPAPQVFQPDKSYSVTLNSIIGYAKDFSTDVIFKDCVDVSLEEAFVITLVYEHDFMLQAFPPKIPINFVCPLKNRHKDDEISEEDRARLHVLHYPGRATMQAKLWILKYSSHIRVVISSANMKPMDWNCMSENFWYQDFPKSRNAEHTKLGDEFVTIIRDFISSLQVGIDSSYLLDYDFSKVKVYLVPSVPGYHHDENLYRYGHMRMRYLLSQFDFPFQSDQPPPIDAQTSNVGSLHKQWLLELYNSFMGNMNDGNKSSKVTNKSRPNMRIVFPSSNTMMNSIYGADNGWYFYYLDKDIYAIPLLHDTHHTNYDGLLLHSKMYIREKDGIGWVYAGGHNLSGSAWGRLHGSKDNLVLELSNFELGVLFVKTEKAGNYATTSDPFLRLGNLFVPFPKDPKPYGPNDTPWKPSSWKQ